MTEVGDYVIPKGGVLRGELCKVISKYYGNGSYLFNCYIVMSLISKASFEYYRKEFTQINKDKVMVEVL